MDEEEEKKRKKNRVLGYSKSLQRWISFLKMF